MVEFLLEPQTAPTQEYVFLGEGNKQAFQGLHIQW